MVVSRKWLFCMVLAVPLVGFGVSEGIQAYLHSELQFLLRKEYPFVPEYRLAQITIDRLCQDSRSRLRSLCGTNSTLNLISRASIGAAAVGLFLLLFIRLAGGLSRKSRLLLVALFAPGLYITGFLLIGLVLIHAGIAMAAIFYAESILVGRIHAGIVAAIGFGALVGVVALARSTFSLVRKAETFVVGKAIGRGAAPALWNQVEAVAQQLGALAPDNLVVGLDPNFFVTEADVICLNGRLKGRTLYCSLPLCRILSREEVASILGHELGHFEGRDTEFSKRFYPIYRGTTSSIAALQAAGAEGYGALALLPAIALLSYFLECFSVAESHLSRERELAADRAGASVTSPRVIAAALVKLHAFTSVWDELQEAAVKVLRQGKAFVDLSSAYAQMVNLRAHPAALQGLADTHLSHPTDSHPPLSVRLRSLQVEVNDVASEGLAVRPNQPAIMLISDPETLEAELSEAYQLVLARQRGVDLGKARQEAEARA